MKTKRILLPVLAALFGSLHSNAQSPNWQLVWSDEFNGSSIDPNNWTYDTGGGGWGNNELEYYTSRAANSFIATDPTTGNGCLVIQALQEQYRNQNYTSARLKTQGLHNWTYGKIEASIKVPNGVGVWPAFWMLGANFSSVGWPACGELDIMEHVLPIGATTIRGSAHAPNYSGANSVHCDATLANLSGQFHTFTITWSPTEIDYLVDGIEYFYLTPQTYSCGPVQSLPGAWIFDHPFFIILNLAIGGNWPGPPDATTVFPVQMWVDWVRVYADANLQPPGSTLKVAKIGMASASNGPNWQAVATVTVVDGNGSPVSGVTVNGAWTGLSNVGVNQQATDSNGVAVLSSGRVKASGTITFCVTSMSKTGYTYIAGQDCASITH
jgi:beta-glucanase (GH16 family)